MDVGRLQQAAEQVRSRFPDARPACAVVLGSGWANVAEAVEPAWTLPYQAVPLLGATGVEGHSGRLHCGPCNGVEALVFQGRRHWYEGRGWEPIALPVFLAKAFGANTVLLTNAAGAVSARLAPGTIMAVDDHINAMGTNPLIGPHDPLAGPRFADQSEVYDQALRSCLDAAAHQAGVPLEHGVYLAVPGPAYETPSEIAAFRTLGADAVGMSTVPEAMVANAIGLRVAALSCITNAAAGSSQRRLSHAEVLNAASRLQPQLRALIENALPAFAANRPHHVP